MAPASERALQYYRTGNVWWVVATVWWLGVPLLLVVTGTAGRLGALALRWTQGRWLLAVILVFLLYSLLDFLLDLPLGYAAGFLRQHAYDLSNQTFAKWIADRVKGLAVGLAGGAAVVWLPYLLMARSRRWWLWTGLASLPLALFVTFVSPIWIAPLFNDFGPMKDEALEERILALAERAGMDADRVWEVDKSVDTKRVNAYVTGFLGTHRVVLWDTLLARLDDDEVLFVMAHELGHYALGHLFRGILLGTLGALVGLFALDRIARAAIARWGSRWRIDSPTSPASLPLLVLILNGLTLVGSPIALAASRWQEHEADRFALELTHDNAACGGAFAELQSSNLSNPYPGPIYRFWRATHPPIGDRVAFCAGYRPWAENRAGRYTDRFTPAGRPPDPPAR